MAGSTWTEAGTGGAVGCAVLPLRQAEGGWPIWIAVAAALLLVLGLLSLSLLRSRRNAWQRFARRHGLRYEQTGDGPLVRGSLEGRPFRMKVSGQSSDTGVLGVEEIHLALGLREPPPEGLEIDEAPGLAGVVHKALEGDAIETGDEEFDRQVVVRAPLPEAARDWLTEERKAAIRDLVEHSESGVAGLEGREIFIEDRKIAGDLDQLEDRLRRMLAVARRLDGERSRA